MQNTLYKEKYEGAKEVQDSIEIIILGTSRATYGVNPEAFGMYAYNLANLGQSLYFDKRITLSLLPEMPQLKYVFISIDYHSLAFSSQLIETTGRIMEMVLDIRIQSISGQYLPTLFGYTPKVAFSMLKKTFKLLALWI